MPEQPDDLARSSPSDLPSSSEEYKDALLIDIESRLANAKNSDEAVFWLRVRSELIQQNVSLVQQRQEIIQQNEIVKNGEQRRNEIAKDGQQKRYIEKFKLFRRTGISVSALILGTVAISSGAIWPGLVILGVAFYEVAPDYVKARFPGKSKEEETDEDKEDG